MMVSLSTFASTDQRLPCFRDKQSPRSRVSKRNQAKRCTRQRSLNRSDEQSPDKDTAARDKVASAIQSSNVPVCNFPPLATSSGLPSRKRAICVHDGETREELYRLRSPWGVKQMLMCQEESVDTFATAAGQHMRGRRSGDKMTPIDVERASCPRQSATVSRLDLRAPPRSSEGRMTEQGRLCHEDATTEDITPSTATRSTRAEMDSEDEEFIEHMRSVAIKAALSKEHDLDLRRATRTVIRLRQRHRQELLALLEDEQRRERHRQKEIRAALSDKVRHRLYLRHERERRVHRLGIERVRFDQQSVLGTVLVDSGLLR